MTQADDRILETLEDSGLKLSPAILAENIDYSRHYVSRRLKKLLKAGLVDRVDEGLYQISPMGTKYLAGDLGTDDLHLDNED